MTSTLRASLRSRLTLAMRQRDREAAAVLRSAIAAIENAEAVPSPDAEGARGPSATSSARVAGAAVGVGATEAQRRFLDAAAERAIVVAEVALLHEAQQAYAAAGDAPRAQSAAGGVTLLHAVLCESAQSSP
ncbi:hypothetical protein FHX52_2187 [Humibacillus xanthopallidus]|uniref:Uncharacterized protein n=1 Tax=Humibacillus xanthopallidus TaxID=412689 RepID=A0A543PYB1_9MICO|nr:hypothetical protein [Humibacillus xanthopallidus]TQN49030.1 hypothetical protein FHX52_2187 [Humibacillus xanthopallidus]